MPGENPEWEEPRLTVRPGPVPIHGTRRFRRIVLPLFLATVLGVVVMVGQGYATAPFTSTDLLDGYAGSKADFFDDPEIRHILMAHHIQVRATEIGSREISSQDLAPLQFAFPSGRPAAQLITDKLARRPATYAPFISPLVVATFREYVRVLENAGVVEPQPNQDRRAPIYYTLHLGAFLDLVARRTTWNELGIEKYGRPNGKNILAQTSDVCRANHASMWLGLVSYARSPDADHVPHSEADAVDLARKIKPLLVGQGFPGADLDKGYLSPDGRTIAPVAVMYEHQYLAHQIDYQAQTGHVDTQRVLLYPDIAFQSEPEFIALKDGGTRLGELLMTDPELRARATELGFRLIDTRDYSAHGKLTEFLTSRHIPAPDNEFATASLPKPDYLEAMIKEVGDGCPADR